jgi:hypothetical protein
VRALYIFLAGFLLWLIIYFIPDVRSEIGMDLSYEALMKSYRKEPWFNIPSRGGLVKITPEVESAMGEKLFATNIRIR